MWQLNLSSPGVLVADVGSDAHGDVLRGLQVVESACAVTSLLMGDKIEVSKDMDTETRRLPLGVCARSLMCYTRVVLLILKLLPVLHRSIFRRMSILFLPL